MVEAPGIESWGRPTEGDQTGVNAGIGDDDLTPDATVGGGSISPKDDSGAIPPPAREALRVALRNATNDRTLVDVLARVQDHPANAIDEFLPAACRLSVGMS